MGEESSKAQTQSDLLGVKDWYGNWKAFWSDRFTFLTNYANFTLYRDEPLKKWSSSDVEAFIALDPVHGPTLKTAREATKFALVGSAIGAASLGGLSWKYSRSPHGALLALGAGAFFGSAFGCEVANHALQLYRLDTMTAQTKFLEWWENKTEG